MDNARAAIFFGLALAVTGGAGCGGGGDASGSGASASGGGDVGGHGPGSSTGSKGNGGSGVGGGGAGPGAGGAGPGGGGGGGGAPVPAGWLYTVAGENRIYISNGQSGSTWVGRGVNADDLFLCGYNTGMWMTNPDGAQAMQDVVSNIASQWNANFFRVSLSMNSFMPVCTWVGSSAYKNGMTDVIHALGAIPGTYVLVTLRSDASMVDTSGGSCGHNDDAVCLPTNATDDTYRALVDTFKDAPYVLFGLSNEPLGGSTDQQKIVDAMTHAVGVIRAEEDSLGVPHHLVSVQGRQWTSVIDFYNSAPIPEDNVVYEYHSYPPDPSGYTQSSIPVIIGEYGPGGGGDLGFAQAFFADIEAKSIPSLAWDAAAYSPCQPELLQVTYDASLATTGWGDAVKGYLKSH
jgi:cellulase (glycosyl hydrolase family 5)